MCVQMFFINRGTVDVVSEDGTVVFASMGEGQFFGEISLVFSCPRTASIRLELEVELLNYVMAVSSYNHTECT